MNRNLYRSLTENSLSYFFPNSSLIIAVVVVFFFFSLRFLFSDTVINLLIFSPLKFCYRCRCLFVGFFFLQYLPNFLEAWICCLCDWRYYLMLTIHQKTILSHTGLLFTIYDGCTKEEWSKIIKLIQATNVQTTFITASIQNKFTFPLFFITLFRSFLFCKASPGQPMGESLACFNITELNMRLR